MTFMRSLLILLFFSTAAAADDFPAHFNVTGVATDDTLNVRQAPNARAAIVMEYHPYQLNIEVTRVSPDGKWGYVSTGEGNGWTSMRYLERQNHLALGEFPRPFHCSGAEPFWNLDFNIRGTSYSSLALNETYTLETLSEDVVHSGTAIRSGETALRQSPSVTKILTFELASCGDGMSDREFPYSAVLRTQGPDGQSVETGCCSLNSTN